MAERLLWREVMRKIVRTTLGAIVVTCGLTLAAACGSSDFSGVIVGSDAASGDAPASDGSAAIDGASATDSAVPPDAATPDARVDAGPVRPFALAVTGTQIVISGAATGLLLTPANVADDAEIAAVHQEFYGVPWDAFLNGTAPPAEWVAVMTALAKSAKDAAKPVFLSINMLDGTRGTLAPKTLITGGQVKTQERWAAPCYDFATAPDRAQTKAAYLAYVAWMMGTFSPAYLNVAVEVNLFFEKCPSARAGVVDVINAAYDTAKAARADVIAFPSFQLEHVYGYADGSCDAPTDPGKRAKCYDANYAMLAGIKRDRFAMSTYPYLRQFATVADLPADWLTAAAARGSERPVIAETGWLSTGLEVLPATGACFSVLSQTEAEESNYLYFVVEGAAKGNMDLVTWWSDRDLVAAPLMTDCPCTFDATWCQVLDVFRGPAPPDGGTDTRLLGELSLKAFGTMGLRAYDGTPKAGVMARWQAVRAIPRAP